MYNLKLSTDEDKIKAYITITVDEENDEVPVYTVMEYLNSEGVTAEINRDAIIDCISNQLWDSKILIAEGTAPEHGQDGYVKYLFDTNPNPTPQLREDGGIDFHNLNLTENVVKEQMLAKLVPPISGKPGIDVFGNTIPQKAGIEAKIIAGKNTSFKDPKNTLLQATVEGHVKLGADDIVIVDTEFVQRGDVDFKCGNLDIKGDIKIYGDVKAGFKVNASGDVFIEGLVEDTIVEAGGNVVVKGGFLGRGKGIIKAKNELYLNFVHDQRVTAGGKIYISEESINAQISTEDALIMTGGRGNLMGGMVRTGRFVEVNELGNQQNSKTILIVGDVSKLEVQIKFLKIEIEKAEDGMKSIQSAVAKLLELKYGSGWQDNEEEQYRALERKLVEIPKLTNEKIEKMKELEKEANQLKKDAYVRVNGVVHAGVNMKITGFPRKIEDDIAGVVFRVVNKKVEIEPLDD